MCHPVRKFRIRLFVLLLSVHFFAHAHAYAFLPRHKLAFGDGGKAHNRQGDYYLSISAKVQPRPFPPRSDLQAVMARKKEKNDTNA